MAAPTGTKAREMSDEHKAALAEGREQGRAVRVYLEALEMKPSRGRPRDPERVQRRLAQIEEQIATADPLTRLHLFQERIELNEQLTRNDGAAPDIAAAEESFVAVAASYGDRKGITYSTWRACGVPADVLRRAGIARTG